MVDRDGLLFRGASTLTDSLRGNEEKMLREINAIDGDELLNTSPDALADYFEERFTVTLPLLGDDAIEVDDPREIDLSQPAGRIVRGTAITYHVPFTGEAQLFSCRPSTFVMNPLRAWVRGDETGGDLAITFLVAPGEGSRVVNGRFESQFAEIRSYLTSMQAEVTAYNASLRRLASEQIEARRRKLLADRKLVAELGYPLRRRQDAPATDAVPTVRRKPRIERPSGGRAPFAPEPTLDMAEYEQILSIMGNVARVMELSPGAFRTLGEEDLRTHFLVQLNGQYEGQATGETFNLWGKTDIVVRERERNLFIAECKFWNGPKSLSDAIDQLLRYTSWRDTKTAIVVFNKGGKLSTIQEKIPGVVSAHPNYRRRDPYESHTGFRFHLHHRDDPGRELVLTVLVFEVPEPEHGDQPLWPIRHVSASYRGPDGRTVPAGDYRCPHDNRQVDVSYPTATGSCPACHRRYKIMFPGQQARRGG